MKESTSPRPLSGSPVWIWFEVVDEMESKVASPPPENMSESWESQGMAVCCPRPLETLPLVVTKICWVLLGLMDAMRLTVMVGSTVTPPPGCPLAFLEETMKLVCPFIAAVVSGYQTELQTKCFIAKPGQSAERRRWWWRHDTGYSQQQDTSPNYHVLSYPLDESTLDSQRYFSSREKSVPLLVFMVEIIDPNQVCNFSLAMKFTFSKWVHIFTEHYPLQKYSAIHQKIQPASSTSGHKALPSIFF